MQEEALRETDYLAALAGIHTELASSYEYLTFSIVAYNDNVESYLEDVFKSFQNFKVDPVFFHELRERTLRYYQN